MAWTHYETSSAKPALTVAVNSEQSTNDSPMIARTSNPCQEHCPTHAANTTNQDDWSPLEEQQLAMFHVCCGPKWSKLAKLLPSRTQLSIRNQWHSTFRAKHINPARRSTWLYTYIQLLKAGHGPPDAYSHCVLQQGDHVGECFSFIQSLGGMPSNQPSPAQGTPQPPPSPPIPSSSSDTSTSTPTAGSSSTSTTASPPYSPTTDVQAPTLDQDPLPPSPQLGCKTSNITLYSTIISQPLPDASSPLCSPYSPANLSTFSRIPRTPPTPTPTHPDLTSSPPVNGPNFKAATHARASPQLFTSRQYQPQDCSAPTMPHTHPSSPHPASQPPPSTRLHTWPQLYRADAPLPPHSSPSCQPCGAPPNRFPPHDTFQQPPNPTATTLCPPHLFKPSRASWQPQPPTRLAGPRHPTRAPSFRGNPQSSSYAFDPRHPRSPLHTHPTRPNAITAQHLHPSSNPPSSRHALHQQQQPFPSTLAQHPRTTQAPYRSLNPHTSAPFPTSTTPYSFPPTSHPQTHFSQQQQDSWITHSILSSVANVPLLQPLSPHHNPNSTFRTLQPPSLPSAHAWDADSMQLPYHSLSTTQMDTTPYRDSSSSAPGGYLNDMTAQYDPCTQEMLQHTPAMCRPSQAGLLAPHPLPAPARAGLQGPHSLSMSAQAGLRAPSFSAASQAGLQGPQSLCVSARAGLQGSQPLPMPGYYQDSYAGTAAEHTLEMGYAPAAQPQCALPCGLGMGPGPMLVVRDDGRAPHGMGAGQVMARDPPGACQMMADHGMICSMDEFQQMGALATGVWLTGR